MILMPYKFPPSMCMKQTSFIVLMIISVKQMIVNDIDIYLQPFITEL